MEKEPPYLPPEDEHDAQIIPFPTPTEYDELEDAIFRHPSSWHKRQRETNDPRDDYTDET